MSEREQSKQIFWLSAAICLPILVICVGISILRSSTMSLKIANTQLTTQTKANQVKELSERLQSIAEQLEQRDSAYQDLLSRYNELSAKERKMQPLKSQIEQIEKVTTETDSAEIKEELQSTTAALNKLTE
jgi:predicted transcriptional regulator